VKTHSPLFCAHVVLETGSRLELPAEYPERAVYLVAGAVTIEKRELAPTEMIVLDGGGAVALRASSPSILMLLGGEPVGARFIEWNFVSSSRKRIEQAKADWRAGRMKLPDADNAEFIPLPPEPHPSAGAMS